MHCTAGHPNAQTALVQLDFPLGNRHQSCRLCQQVNYLRKMRLNSPFLLSLVLFRANGVSNGGGGGGGGGGGTHSGHRRDSGHSGHSGHTQGSTHPHSGHPICSSNNNVGWKLSQMFSDLPDDTAPINKMLPKELLLRVFSFLDVVSLCRSAQVVTVSFIL